MPYVVTSECQQCGACAAGCDSGAVKEDSEKTSIDKILCIECGICAANCPFQAIVFEEEVLAQ